jgi:hypothetical protein
MREIKVTWKLSISTAWAIYWRVILIGIIPAGAFHYVFSKLEGNPLLLPLVDLAIHFVFLTIATFLVLQKGFGSLKLVFMERTH